MGLEEPPRVQGDGGAAQLAGYERMVIYEGDNSGLPPDLATISIAGRGAHLLMDLVEAAAGPDIGGSRSAVRGALRAISREQGARSALYLVHALAELCARLGEEDSDFPFDPRLHRSFLQLLSEHLPWSAEDASQLDTRLAQLGARGGAVVATDVQLELSFDALGIALGSLADTLPATRARDAMLDPVNLQAWAGFQHAWNTWMRAYLSQVDPAAQSRM
jgi:hypothetical protein